MKNVGRILAVFAHPDDEIFCAGGTLTQYAAGGSNVMVVSATQGDAGQIRDANVATRRTLGAVRAKELQQSCKKLGVNQAVCLDYGDGKLAQIDPTPLTREIVHIIRTFRPDVVITFGPDGAYGHPDHIAIGEITRQAFFKASDSGQFPEQLKNNIQPYNPGRLFFSYFPKNRQLLSDQLVKWLTETKHKFQGTIEFAYALLLFAEESTMLGYSSDNIEIAWFPKGFYIIEQGEPSTKLYLILSGQAEAIYENPDGFLEKQAVLNAGQFFGEFGLAAGETRSAHVVVTQDTTCMILASTPSSNFEPRGDFNINILDNNEETDEIVTDSIATTKIDVSKYVKTKIEALSAYRTQFPLKPDMFPLPMLREVFSYEYYVRVFPPQEMENSLFSTTDII